MIDYIGTEGDDGLQLEIFLGLRSVKWKLDLIVEQNLDCGAESGLENPSIREGGLKNLKLIDYFIFQSSLVNIKSA